VPKGNPYAPPTTACRPESITPPLSRWYRIPAILLFTLVFAFLMIPFTNWTLDLLVDSTKIRNSRNVVMYSLAAIGLASCIVGTFATVRSQRLLLFAALGGVASVLCVLLTYG